MATECFSQFLKSLKTTALVGLLGVLTALESELQADKIKALARQATLSNLLGAVKKASSALGTATLNEIKRLPVGSRAIGLEISPNGKRAFVGCERTDGVHVVDLESLTVADKFFTGDGSDSIAWWVPPEPRDSNGPTDPNNADNSRIARNGVAGK